MQRAFVITAAVAAFFLIESSASAQYVMESFTIDGGGTTLTGATYSLTGTVAQPDPGLIVGATYMLDGGFWPGTLGDTACDGDADANGTVDVNDISYVIFRIGNSGTPGTVDGDADGNGVVDVNDISYVIFRIGPC